MLILAFDTATAGVVVGVAEDGAIRAERRTPGPARHGEALTPSVAAALAAGGWRPGDLAAVVVGVGPGPFTGLRVGMVTAAALGDALDIPVYGVGSLDAVAFGLGDLEGTTYVATDARRREVYWARYVDGVRVEGPHVGPAPDVLGRMATYPPDRVVGAGAVLYDLPGAVAAGPTAAGLLAAAVPLPATARPEPLRAAYLRQPDATEPRPRVAATPR